MQLTLSAAVAALCWSFRLAAASSSHVYIIDEPVASREGHATKEELSPELARLVVAQRAGVEDYHGADLEEDKVVHTLNSYAARGGLFEVEKVVNSLILIEGGADDSILADRYPSFTISPSPSANATRGLFLDLARQAMHSELSNLSDDELYTLLKAGVYKQEELGRQVAIWSENEVMAWLKVTLTTDAQVSRSITIITTPPHSHGEKGADYGTYTMPGSVQSPLRKRLMPTEKPLEAEPSLAAVEQSNTPMISFANQSSPLPGILPACFPSLSACQSTTRNCSGHGSCGKKYTDPTAAKDSRFKVCYACQCSATTSESGSGGVTTTYWGGPACQKKDVSVQFWLIALFSVAMVGLISFAVGQIWSMGSEELPSVIGAGVSGPVKRS